MIYINYMRKYNTIINKNTFTSNCRIGETCGKVDFRSSLSMSHNRIFWSIF